MACRNMYSDNSEGPLGRLHVEIVQTVAAVLLHLLVVVRDAHDLCFG